MSLGIIPSDFDGGIFSKKKMKQKELKKIWDRLQPGYYDDGNLGQKLWQYFKLRAIRRVLPQKTERLLDIGCADGYFLKKVADSLPGTKIYGVDVSEKLIRAGKLKYPEINFVVADAHDLPFKNKEFDLVLSTESLEHFLSPPKALAEMKRVIKPGGKIIIELDSGSLLFRFIFSIWVRFLKGKIWRNAHLQSFNIQKLENLFAKNGLRVEKRIISHLGMAVTFVLSKDSDAKKK